MSIYKLPEDAIENLTFQINPEIRVVTTASNYNLLGSEPLPTLSYVSGAINIVVGNDLRQFDAGSNNSILDIVKFNPEEKKQFLFINSGETAQPLDEYFDYYTERNLILIDTSSYGNTALTTTLNKLLSSAVDQNNKNFKKIQFGVERIDSHTTSSNLFATVSIGTIGTSNEFRDRLLPYYKNIIENIDKNNSPQNLLQLETTSSYDPFAFTNTFCLNLFSSSAGATTDTIVYPDSYTPTGSFTFNFDINIRESLSNPKAGTLLFVSSSYAVSIISGSSKDEENKCDKFRVMLQIASGTDILPESISTSSAPTNCFISDDNVLETNKWHNVVIRWGTNQINNGKGDFLVDGIEAGSFIINSSSFPTIVTSSLYDEPSVLFINGRPTIENLISSSIAYKNIFPSSLTGSNLNNDQLLRSQNTPIFKELPTKILTSSVIPGITDIICNNLCNFEVKDIIIYNKFNQTNDLIPKPDKHNSIFYLPVKYQKNNYLKRHRISHADFIGINFIDNNYFNIFISQNFGSQVTNTHNFLKDNIKLNIPILILNSLNSNKYLINIFDVDVKNIFLTTFHTEQWKKNLLIKPIDNNVTYEKEYLNSKNIINNQIFIPSKNESQSQTAGNGNNDFVTNTKIPRDMYYSTSSFEFVSCSINVDKLKEYFNLNQYNPDFLYLLQNSYSSSITSSTDQIKRLSDVVYQIPFTINAINQDNDSALNVVFSISPMLYGNRVLPGSLVLKDTNYLLTGKTMTLKDNGYGGLCRADVEDFSKENIVGRVFYDEGLIIITNPTIYYFGKFGFDITFRGEKNIHVYRVSYSAPMSHLNRSTNNPDVNSDNFSLITGVNFMDENLNVVMKTKLAQPIIKTKNERLDFRTKLDY